MSPTATSSATTKPSETISDRSDSSNQTVDSFDMIPIRIQPGTKNLVLARKLDKESVEGESSVIIGIRCRPKKFGKSKKFPRKITSSEDDLVSSTANDVESRIGANSGADGSSYWIYDTSDAKTNEDDDDIKSPDHDGEKSTKSNKTKTVINLDNTVKELNQQLTKENKNLNCLVTSLHEKNRTLSLKYTQLNDKMESNDLQLDDLKNRIDELEFELNKSRTRVCEFVFAV